MNKRVKRVHHVRFGDDGCESGRSISVEDDDTDIVRVYVGLLKRWHRYRIEVSVQRPYQELLPKDGLANVFHNDCTIESMAETSFGCTLIVNLFVRNFEVSETLTLGNEYKPVQVAITATVLSEEMGTPLLKNGVHLIGKEKQNSSDED